jgi:hypothetical protein
MCVLIDYSYQCIATATTEEPERLEPTPTWREESPLKPNRGRSRTEFTAVTLCPGTFAAVFRSFYRLLLAPANPRLLDAGNQPGRHRTGAGIPHSHPPLTGDPSQKGAAILTSPPHLLIIAPQGLVTLLVLDFPPTTYPHDIHSH